MLAAALLTPDTATIPADASPATAGTVAGLLAALSAAAGVAGPCGFGERVRALPGWLSRGVRAGLAGAAALVAAGAALLLVVLLAHADAVAGSFAAIAPEAGSGAGLWLLDIAYLPNAVIAAVSWLLGPGFALGAVTAAPTGATPGLVPPLPLAALLPAGPPPTWAGLVFALPLAVGSAIGWVLAPGGPDDGSGHGTSGDLGQAGCAADRWWPRSPPPSCSPSPPGWPAVGSGPGRSTPSSSRPRRSCWRPSRGSRSPARSSPSSPPRPGVGGTLVRRRSEAGRARAGGLGRPGRPTRVGDAGAG